MTHMPHEQLNSTA